ncbi:MAG: thymidine phosphorylase [Bacteroidota bacterium]
MLPVELIRKKREGGALTESDLRVLITGYVRGELPDYQMSAFLMACYFRGMTKEETVIFTDLMLHSGSVIDLSDIPGIKVDKHSTGGVGDKVSLILAPIVASRGIPVPMISGRGLGHTGGTLDKLESIPGFRTDIPIPEYRRLVRETGAVMIGQTSEIAPADRKLYALRDVTATVECIPLIASSIMSKKLAEGIDALVLDIKTGIGAFMQRYEDALKLAETLISIGTQFGTRTTGFITAMEQPLGVAVGNWVEVVESVECLRGTRGVNDESSDLMEITHTLAGAMIQAGGKANSLKEGMAQSRGTITDGSAYKKFLEIVRAQGGNTAVVENLEAYPISRHHLQIKSDMAGFVGELNAYEVGQSAILLGAGRKKLADVLDPKAGILLRKKVGNNVEPGDVLAEILCDRDEDLSEARGRLKAAFKITPHPPKPRPLIHCFIDQAGIHPWEPR